MARATFTPLEAALVGLVIVAAAVLTGLGKIDATATVGIFSSVVGYVLRAVSRAGGSSLG